jgi:N-acetylneuraminic acid mutarotase
MKKPSIFLSIILLNCLRTWSQPIWVQVADFPGPERDDGVSFTIGTKAYCGSGLQVGWSPGGDFYQLDLLNDSWAPITSLPAGKERQYACGFSDGTNGYVFGGESGGNDLTDLWMYSPASNSWVAKTSKPGNGLRGAACFVIGNNAYFAGGAYQSNAGLNEVWAYNMSTDTWSQKNNLPLTCWRGTATSTWAGKGYLLFGRELNGRFIKELYEYEPTSDTWTLKNNFPGKGRSYANMQVMDNKLVVFGGVDTLNTYYNELWTFDFSASPWQQLISMPSAGRKGGMGFQGYMSSYYYTCGIDQSNTRLKQTWKAQFPDAIEEYSNRKKITVYPDPAEDVVTIAHLKSAEKFTLSDLAGRIVNEGITSGTIDVSGLSPGLYFLSLNGFSAKIIKQ